MERVDLIMRAENEFGHSSRPRIRNFELVLYVRIYSKAAGKFLKQKKIAENSTIVRKVGNGSR